MPDPFFASNHSRHTNKGSYDSSNKVPIENVNALSLAAASFSPQGSALNVVVADILKMQKMWKTTRLAYQIELSTPRTELESAKLLRVGPSEIDQHRDEISITDFMPRLLNAVGMFDRFEVPVKGSSNFKRFRSFQK
jgi:hypothetical protein